jgi:hypothetical protein
MRGERKGGSAPEMRWTPFFRTVIHVIFAIHVISNQGNHMNQTNQSSDYSTTNLLVHSWAPAFTTTM